MSAARSTPAQARGLLGSSIRIALEGGREWGVGIRGDARGWRLSIGSSASPTSVVFVDETAATHDKWVLSVNRGLVLLDGARFRGGHAYRVEIRRGATTIDRGLVYLYPTRGGRSAHLSFGEDALDVASSTDEDPIRIQPKSAL